MAAGAAGAADHGEPHLHASSPTSCAVGRGASLSPLPTPPTTTAATPAQMIEDAGFQGVDYENLTAGVVAIHSGFKMA